MAQDNDPELLAKQADRALKAGLPFDALALAIDALRRFPYDAGLRRSQGLALARCGASEQAYAILTQLALEGYRDEETLGMRARLHKDFALAAVDPAERARHLRDAHEIYTDAHARTGGYWTAINAATLAVLLDNKTLAVEQARVVRDQCLREWQTGAGDRYYLAATLGEAEIILNNFSEAERWYREAAEFGAERSGDRSSTRRQARLLLRHLGQAHDWVDGILAIPKVAVFVGHMCDQAGRQPPRFPARLEGQVHSAIRERLQTHHALIGFSSAACGADILFLESLLDLQGEPHAVLPYEKEQFAHDSVDIVPGWRSRYDTVLAQLSAAGRVSQCARGKMELTSVSYDYANLVVHGMAIQRARELDTGLLHLAVWDGRSDGGPGGTSSVVKRWREQGRSVEVIDLAEILRRESLNLPVKIERADAPKAVAAPTLPETRILAMLFADAVGYSKMTEPQAVKFTKHCLGMICKALLDWHGGEAIVRESRGDGVYLGFERVRDAGLFALHLQDLMKRDWTALGLPADLRLRVGLHAGPAVRCFDPILGAQTWTGAHVSHAARIEPKTAPGEVYASGQFAALAALEQIPEFACQFVGNITLDKDHGTYPLFVLRRRGNVSYS